MNKEILSMIGFKSLLSTLKESAQKAFFSLLSSKDQELLKITPLVAFDSLLDSSVETFIDSIDASWIHYVFEKKSAQDHLVISYAFPKQKNDLIKIFSIADESIALSPLASQYIRHYAYDALLELKEKTYPVYVEKENQLYGLLNLKTDELKNLLFALGLYDFKREMNHLIDTSKVLSIKESWEKKFLLFLQDISKEQEQLHLPLIGLNYWDGNLENLNLLLYHRGLNRMAKILSVHSVNFYWHFQLLLPIDDAKILKKFMVKI